MPLYVKNKAPDLNERLRMSTARMTVYLYIGDNTEPLKSFCFIGDLTKQTVDLYLDRKTSVWTKVRVAFDQKNSPPFMGKIIWSQRYAFDAATKAKRFNNWRAGIKFIFASEQERERFNAFYDDSRKRFSADAYKLLESEVEEDKGTMDALDALDDDGDESIGAADTAATNDNAVAAADGPSASTDDVTDAIDEAIGADDSDSGGTESGSSAAA